MTSDLWTANITNEPFITITCHCIIDFQLYDFVLSTRSFSAVAHTGQNISLVLNASKSLWNLDNKIVGIVTDNASNITNAVLLSNNELVRCHAHTLQLCIKDSLASQSEIEKTLTKCRRLVAHFKHSSVSKLRRKYMRLILVFQRPNLFKRFKIA